MPQIRLLVTVVLVLPQASRVLQLLEQVVAGALLKGKLLVQVKAAAVMGQIIILPLALVLPTQVAVVEAVDMQVVMVVQVAQAALVSLSSKSHLRTMPHSHLV